jgi:hypothetical protein
MALLIFMVFVCPIYARLCLYIGREMKLALNETFLLYGIPVFLCVAYLVNQHFAVDYHTSGFWNILFLAVVSSILPVGGGYAFFESDYWKRSQPTEEDWLKLKEERESKNGSES